MFYFQTNVFGYTIVILCDVFLIRNKVFVSCILKISSIRNSHLLLAYKKFPLRISEGLQWVSESFFNKVPGVSSVIFLKKILTTDILQGMLTEQLYCGLSRSNFLRVVWRIILLFIVYRIIEKSKEATNMKVYYKKWVISFTSLF